MQERDYAGNLPIGQYRFAIYMRYISDILKIIGLLLSLVVITIAYRAASHPSSRLYRALTYPYRLY